MLSRMRCQHSPAWPKELPMDWADVESSPPDLISSLCHLEKVMIYTIPCWSLPAHHWALLLGSQTSHLQMLQVQSECRILPSLHGAGGHPYLLAGEWLWCLAWLVTCSVLLWPAFTSGVWSTGRPVVGPPTITTTNWATTTHAWPGLNALHVLWFWGSKPGPHVYQASNVPPS
jgi:hypothetical protein